MGIVGYVIGWIALSIISWVIASNKGRSGFGFFLLSLILSPVIGIIGALVVSQNTDNIEAKKVSSGTSKKCPKCAELIKREATVCRFCSHSFEEDSKTLQAIQTYFCDKCGRITESLGDRICHDNPEDAKRECTGYLRPSS